MVDAGRYRARLHASLTAGRPSHTLYRYAHDGHKNSLLIGTLSRRTHTRCPFWEKVRIPIRGPIYETS